MYTFTLIAGMTLTFVLVGHMFYLRVKGSRTSDDILKEIPEHQLPFMKAPMVKYQKKAFEKMCDRWELVDALHYPLNEPQDIWHDAHYHLVVTREETGIRYKLTDIAGKCQFSAYIDLLTTKKEFQLALMQKDEGKSQRLLMCFNSQVQRIREQLNEPISFLDSKERADKMKNVAIKLPKYETIKTLLTELEKEEEWIVAAESKHKFDLVKKKFSLLERNVFLLKLPQNINEPDIQRIKSYLRAIEKTLFQLQTEAHETKISRLHQHLQIVEKL